MVFNRNKLKEKRIVRLMDIRHVLLQMRATLLLTCYVYQTNVHVTQLCIGVPLNVVHIKYSCFLCILLNS